MSIPDAALGALRLRNVSHRIIGTVGGGDELKIRIGGETVVLPLRKIRDAGEEITRMMQ